MEFNASGENRPFPATTRFSRPASFTLQTGLGKKPALGYKYIRISRFLAPCAGDPTDGDVSNPYQVQHTAGIGCGTVAFVGYGVPLTTSLVGAGLCSIGGILPDIDSGPGIPLREITTFLASVVPTMLITRLLSYNFTQESLILAGAVIYVAIRFGLSHFLREYTVHRGMFHSIPSMAIFGELTYLLFYGESMFVRLFMVAAVCLGFFIHLLLDEIYSVEWDGRPHLKNSFGTAMKFVGHGWWPNFACYAKLAVLTFLVMNDPSVIHQIYTGQGQEVAKNLGQTVKDEFGSALAAARSKSSGRCGPFGPDFCRPGGQIGARHDGSGKLGHRAAAFARLALRFSRDDLCAGPCPTSDRGPGNGRLVNSHRPVAQHGLPGEYGNSGKRELRVECQSAARQRHPAGKLSVVVACSQRANVRHTVLAIGPYSSRSAVTE